MAEESPFSASCTYTSFLIFKTRRMTRRFSEDLQATDLVPLKLFVFVGGDFNFANDLGPYTNSGVDTNCPFSAQHGGQYRAAWNIFGLERRTMTRNGVGGYTTVCLNGSGRRLSVVVAAPCSDLVRTGNGSFATQWRTSDSW